MSIFLCNNNNNNNYAVQIHIKYLGRLLITSILYQYFLIHQYNDPRYRFRVTSGSLDGFHLPDVSSTSPRDATPRCNYGHGRCYNSPSSFNTSPELVSFINQDNGLLANQQKDNSKSGKRSKSVDICLECKETVQKVLALYYNSNHKCI